MGYIEHAKEAIAVLQSQVTVPQWLWLSEAFDWPRSRAHKREEHVTAHPGCGPGENVALCLNILFIVDQLRGVQEACHPSLHSLLTGG